MRDINAPDDDAAPTERGRPRGDRGDPGRDAGAARRARVCVLDTYGLKKERRTQAIEALLDQKKESEASADLQRDPCTRSDQRSKSTLMRPVEVAGVSSA
jgi:hypothetical protein